MINWNPFIRSAPNPDKSEPQFCHFARKIVLKCLIVTTAALHHIMPYVLQKRRAISSSFKFRIEIIRCFTLIYLPNLQHGAGKSTMVGRVREILCFQTESPMSAIGGPALSFRTAIQKVSGIKLDAGQGRQSLHINTGIWRPCQGGRNKCAVPSVNHPVMVVLPRPKGLELPQIHGGPLHGLYRPGRD